MGRKLGAVVVALALVGVTPASPAELAPTSGLVVIQADELRYDDELGLVVAAGHVEIAQGERVLLADTVSYNQRADVVTASGNVVLLEPSGEVLFADYVELADELKRGIVRGLRMRLTDGSRLAAAGGQRRGAITEMRKVVYSPCELCPDEPERLPLWQLRAQRVIHDKRTRDIIYNNVFLEVFGLPVAYTPYFRHPDPTVKRRSGLLTPTYGSSSFLGATLQVPYYVNIAPYRDVTFAPIITTKEGVVLAGEYREQISKGRFLWNGSITRVDRRDDSGERIGGEKTRGHIEGKGFFDIDETWRWGFDVARSTDDTYLRRYKFSDADTLTSRLFAEGFRERTYASGTAYLFQGLRPEDDPGETPIIAPLLDYNFVGEPGARGGRYSIDANLMVLTRTDGADSRRLSLAAGWRLPYTAPAGDVYTLTASLRGDAYHVDNVPHPGRPTEPTQRGLTGRIWPKLALDWRFPFARQEGTVRQLIEPIVIAVVTPFGGNPEMIPNEDSLEFEFDDTNLFSLERFRGLDRVEGGPRLNYGLKLGAFTAAGAQITALIGQSYRVKDDSTFAVGTGLDRNFSDLVGRLTVSPSPLFDLAYRFRWDRDNLASRRNEVDALIGSERLRLSIGYIFLADAPGAAEELGRREELALSGQAEITHLWTVTADTRRDLTGDGTISSGASVIYEDECVVLSVRLARRFTRDRDVTPDTSLRFRVTLKNLG